MVESASAGSELGLDPPTAIARLWTRQTASATMPFSLIFWPFQTVSLLYRKLCPFTDNVSVEVNTSANVADS
jgi:hypothetical protein